MPGAKVFWSDGAASQPKSLSACFFILDTVFGYCLAFSGIFWLIQEDMEIQNSQ
jgi:hypothetical protein